MLTMNGLVNGCIDSVFMTGITNKQLSHEPACSKTPQWSSWWLVNCCSSFYHIFTKPAQKKLAKQNKLQSYDNTRGVQ